MAGEGQGGGGKKCTNDACRFVHSESEKSYKKLDAETRKKKPSTRASVGYVPSIPLFLTTALLATCPSQSAGMQLPRYMSSGPEGLLQRTHLSRYPEEPPGTWFPQIAEGTVPSPDMTVRTEAAHGEGQLGTEAGSCKKVTLCSESKVSSCRKIPQDDVDLHTSSHTHGIRCPVRAGFQPRNIESGIVSQEWAHCADHCLPAELVYSDQTYLPKEQLAEGSGHVGPVPSPDIQSAPRLHMVKAS